MSLRAVDLSHHQNPTSAQGTPLPLGWAQLGPAVDAVLVKVTEGTATLDPAAQVNMAGARGAGKLLGTYHYAGQSVLGTVGDPQAEAAWFVRWCDHRGAEPVVLDWEPKLTPTDPDAWVAAWCSRVRDLLGVVPWVYTSQSRAAAGTWAATRALGCRLWVARYGANDGTMPATGPGSVGAWGSWVGWQYTSLGRLPGVPGPVDLSTFELDAEGWRQAGGAAAPLPPVGPPAPPPPPAPLPPPASYFRAAYGDVGPGVARLQGFLRRYAPSYAGDLPATGRYLDQTTAVVREFAHRSGIPQADGRNVGPLVAAALARAGFGG